MENILHIHKWLSKLARNHGSYSKLVIQIFFLWCIILTAIKISPKAFNQRRKIYPQLSNNLKILTWWFCENETFKAIKPFSKYSCQEHFLTLIQDTLKAFDNSENKNESAWSNIFLYIKVYIFQKFIQYTMHWNKTHMLKNLLQTK